MPLKQRMETKFPHLFAVKEIDKLPGLFKPRRYLYHCARCKWTFVVNDGRRGALRPMAEDGVKLTREQVVARAETFAAGPCPGMGVLAEASIPANGNGNGDRAHDRWWSPGEHSNGAEARPR